MFVAATYGLSWTVVYYLSVLFFSGSEARTSYGTLSGWWCALYISSVLRIRGAYFYALVAVAIPWVAWRVLRSHDFAVQDLLTPYGVRFLAANFFLFLSPYLVNTFLDRALRRWRG
jgi:hypothetical protein